MIKRLPDPKISKRINRKRRINTFIAYLIGYTMILIFSFCSAFVLSIIPGGFTTILLLILQNFEVLKFSNFICVLPFLCQFIIIFSIIGGCMLINMHDKLN